MGMGCFGSLVQGLPNIDPNPNLGSRVSATDDRMRYAWLVLVQEAI